MYRDISQRNTSTSTVAANDVCVKVPSSRGCSTLDFLVAVLPGGSAADGVQEAADRLDALLLLRSIAVHQPRYNKQQHSSVWPNSIFHAYNVRVLLILSSELQLPMANPTIAV